MTKRTEQVSEVLRRAIQSVINEGFGDPRLQGSVITVTKVTTDTALKTAVVWVSVMPEERESRVMHGLASAGRHLRRRAAELVSVHRMPEFTFKVDEQVKRQAGVLAALNMARDERETKGEAGTAHEEAPGGENGSIQEDEH